MVIHESAEDYLESILVLQQRRGQVRSIDIVNELGYPKPSVRRGCGKTVISRWMRTDSSL